MRVLIHSWKIPVLSNKGKVSCSRKQPSSIWWNSNSWLTNHESDVLPTDPRQPLWVSCMPDPLIKLCKTLLFLSKQLCNIIVQGKNTYKLSKKSENTRKRSWVNTIFLVHLFIFHISKESWVSEFAQPGSH